MNKQSVIDSLLLAFSDVARDEDCTLHQAQLVDQSLRREITEAEYSAAKHLDPHQHWADVPAADIDACDASLSHVTPEAWRFYIPAYMKRSLELLDKSMLDTDLPGSVIFHLSYPEKDAVPMRMYVLERFKTLDEKQAAAVALFLKFVSEYISDESDYRDEARVALKAFWALSPAKRPDLSIILS